MKRGISGGKKKRLTTGEMIIGPARALFMDKITNGLDCSTAYQIVSYLQQLAHITDAAVLVSILQPSPESFDLFDDIILLGGGKIVYHGPRVHVLEFFESCGFKCLGRKGVADFLQEVISKKDQVQYCYGSDETYIYHSVDMLSRKFKESSQGKILDEELSRPFVRSKVHKDAIICTPMYIQACHVLIEAGIVAAQSLLRKSCTLLENPKHMVPSWTEAGARILVTRFLNGFIATGCLILLEEGGTMFTFEGTTKKSSLKVSVRVHSPQFYWKVATQADLGLADAYINGDISFVDKNEGLLNLFMIFVSNRDLKASVPSSSFKRGWWTPLLLTAGLASAKYFFKHVSRQNTLTQARRNISRHYDLSNELFSLFLDETMTYSCAIFNSEDQDLKVAQLRKISILIEKAKISKEHHVLEIGFGWGSLAIEVVKRTGCQYTGITLSEKQLRYAQQKVKEAGLQDHIRFLLCDYRQLPDTYKYDRIISCEMLEAVGHEFMEKFFSSCNSILAENGILVLQFTSIPDERYEEYRQSSDFIKEYIFPGGCLPSLSRVTTAMAAASRLCVEHLENMGIHYYQTLRCWRTNFLEKQSKILELGFDEKFIRTWEYYFDYCAAGFKTCTLGNYQVVFSRPGNVVSFGNLQQGVPLAY